jgi:hypothetical protein
LNSDEDAYRWGNLSDNIGSWCGEEGRTNMDIRNVIEDGVKLGTAGTLV